MSPTVRQTSYRLACAALRDVLLDAARRGSDRGIRPVPYRACAALYSLLLDHPVDRRGRCRSCRRPGTVLGLRRRRCLVRVTAGYWLFQPDDGFLLAHLTSELGLTTAKSFVAEAASRTASAPAPAVSPGEPPAPRAGP
ncbi:MAG: hypothetical protein LC799_30360 [Actinobacteria bacterium]|nr:hypothetical protein [Actinomycetota bacterium]